jgi:hypothetical protein
VILAVDCDLLMTEPGSVLAGRQWAQGRHTTSAETADMNRLYAVEPTLSVTGSNADHRLALPASQSPGYLMMLALELAGNGVQLGPVGAAIGKNNIEGVPERWLSAVAKDLVANKGKSLVVVGSRQPAAVHALAHAINQGLGTPAAR